MSTFSNIKGNISGGISAAVIALPLALAFGVSAFVSIGTPETLARVEKIMQKRDTLPDFYPWWKEPKV